MKSLTDTVPLCVDLDGTLILTDSIHESLSRLLVTRPWRVMLVPLWLLAGRANLKRRLAQSIDLDAKLLPYRQELVSFLNKESSRGRPMVLATAADEKLAKKVANHLGFFSRVVASDGRQNLKGKRKAAILEQMYGAGGFDYVGDSLADIPVWAKARKALAVGVSPGKLRRIKRSVRVEPLFHSTSQDLSGLVKLLRPHHWVKNILVFSPIFLSNKFHDPAALAQSVSAFLAFSLAASTVYIINDFLDLEVDRSHPVKKHRPFASGAIPINYGLFLAAALLIAALAIASVLPSMVTYLLVAYIILNLAYTLRIKRVLFLDVLFLASCYVLRILVGSAATGIPITPWFMAFSLFLFLSLALVKRVSELVKTTDGESHSSGRCYEPGDLSLLLIFGATSGYLSVLVFALYLNSDVSLVSSLYRFPGALWGICPILLFWLSRLWLLTARGEVGSDPIVFAFKDKMSYVVGLMIVTVWCGALGLLTPS